MTVSNSVTPVECPGKVIYSGVTKTNLQSINCTCADISVSLFSEEEKREILAEKRHYDAISDLIDEA